MLLARLGIYFFLERFSTRHRIPGTESGSVSIQCGVFVPLCDKSRGCKGEELRSEFVTVTVNVGIRLGKGSGRDGLSLK